MKKYYLILAAMAAVSVSCQKNDSRDVIRDTECHPVSLTLTASIEGSGTKVSYTDESNALKAAWEAGDKLSLVALDKSGKVLSNDVFSATKGGSSADFAGTYSNPEGASSVAVFYPALTEGDGSDSSPWTSKQIDKEEGNPLLYNFRIGNKYIGINSSYRKQTANANPASLKNLAIMRGEITELSSLTSSKATASLKNCCYVIKATVKVPTSITSVNYLMLKVSGELQITMTGWTVPGNKFIAECGTRMQTLDLALGDKIIAGHCIGSGVPPKDGTITAYPGGIYCQSNNSSDWHIPFFKIEQQNVF